MSLYQHSSSSTNLEYQQQQAAPDDTATLLKIVLTVYSSYASSEGWSPMSLTVADLSNLTPQTMAQLITAVLACIDSSYRLENYREPIPIFDSFGLSTGTLHDTTPFHLLEDVKKYFPENTEYLQLYVFMFPNQYAKEVKEIVVHLMGFFIAINSFEEVFRPEWDLLNGESQEKSALFSEIEEMKQMINVMVQEIQGRKEIKPQLEEKLKELKEEVAYFSGKFRELEGRIRKAQSDYDSRTEGLRTLESRMKALELTKSNLEDQVVASADDVILAFNAELEKSKRMLKRRELLGKEIKIAAQKEQHFTALIEKGERSIRKFEELIDKMQAIGVELATNSKAQALYDTKKRELLELMRKIEQSREDLKKKKRGMDQIRKKNEAVVRLLEDAKLKKIRDINIFRAVRQDFYVKAKDVEKTISVIKEEMAEMSEYVELYKRQMELCNQEFANQTEDKYVELWKQMLTFSAVEEEKILGRQIPEDF